GLWWHGGPLAAVSRMRTELPPRIGLHPPPALGLLPRRRGKAPRAARRERAASDPPSGQPRAGGPAAPGADVAPRAAAPRSGCGDTMHRSVHRSAVLAPLAGRAGRVLPPAAAALAGCAPNAQSAIAPGGPAAERL